MKRWSRQQNETGQAKICQSPRGIDLKEDGIVIASVRPIMDGLTRKVEGWYWYGLGNNSCNKPVSTMEEAKAQVMEYIKRNL